MASAPYVGGGGQVELDDRVFSEPFHNSLVHETVQAELAARRRGTASTKTRGEIAMTGAKEWRQKGTGRARVGALSTPNRVGGGVAFGPRPRSYTVKVNRKARRRALRAVLSVHARRDSLAVVDPSDYETPSTKRAAPQVEGDRRTLVVVAASEDGCAKSFRNLPQVRVVAVERVGVADVMAARRLLVSPAALERLTALASPPAPRSVGGASPAEAEAVSS